MNCCYNGHFWKNRWSNAIYYLYSHLRYSDNLMSFWNCRRQQLLEFSDLKNINTSLNVVFGKTTCRHFWGAMNSFIFTILFCKCGEAFFLRVSPTRVLHKFSSKHYAIELPFVISSFSLWTLHCNYQGKLWLPRNVYYTYYALITLLFVIFFYLVEL